MSLDTGLLPLSTIKKIWKHKYLVFFSSVGAFSFTALEAYYVGFKELETIFASTYFQSLVFLGIIGSVANYGIHYLSSKGAPSKAVLSDKQVESIIAQILAKLAVSDNLRDIKVKTALDVRQTEVETALDARHAEVDTRDTTIKTALDARQTEVDIRDESAK